VVKTIDWQDMGIHAFFGTSALQRYIVVRPAGSSFAQLSNPYPNSHPAAAADHLRVQRCLVLDLVFKQPDPGLPRPEPSSQWPPLLLFWGLSTRTTWISGVRIPDLSPDGAQLSAGIASPNIASHCPRVCTLPIGLHGSLRGDMALCPHPLSSFPS
jgi:hypothetical protein